MEPTAFFGLATRRHDSHREVAGVQMCDALPLSPLRVAVAIAIIASTSRREDPIQTPSMTVERTEAFLCEVAPAGNMANGKKFPFRAACSRKPMRGRESRMADHR